jgi:hypothetical protein
MLATLYGAFAHLVLGGRGREFVSYILAAWIGFAIGQAFGNVMDIRVLAIGTTNTMAATLGSLVALATLAFLANRRPGRRS